jgi:hypothetical protein
LKSIELEPTTVDYKEENIEPPFWYVYDENIILFSSEIERNLPAGISYL